MRERGVVLAGANGEGMRETRRKLWVSLCLDGAADVAERAPAAARSE
jgi:hypothetical protein